MRKAGVWLIGGLRKVKIFYRLLAMFLLATLLPITIFTIWSYRENSNVIREKVFVSVDEMLNQVSGKLNQKIEKIRNDSIEISYLEEIQDVLENYETYNSRQLNLVTIQVTRTMSKKYVFDNIVSAIILYTAEGDKLTVYGADVSNVDLKEDYLKGFLEICHEQDGKCVFRAVNRSHEKKKVVQNRENAVLVGKAVKQSKTGAIIGYMLMQIEENIFSDVYRDISRNMEAEAFIIDEKGMVVSTAGDYASVGETYPSADLLKNTAAREEQEDLVSLDLGEKSVIFMNRQMEENDWQMILMFPREYLQAGLTRTLVSFAGIALACILLGVVVTFVISISISHPLGKVIEGIGQFEKGNLYVKLDETGADEITRLAEQFNRMAREINGFLEREKDNEKQKRKLEIQALQAQINPHFLANTLNTVSYIARIRKEETIEKLLNATIELLRDSMKNDDSFHTVQEEIALIESYIMIQDYRLLGKFSVEIDIEPEILSCSMPRFILQPVVENAVIHGIEPLNRRGLISVKGFQQESDFVFVITDNGIGMEEKKIKEILQERRNEEKLRFSGMGIGNVDKRIRLLMGKNYGVVIESKKNVFTSVTIRLPMSSG